MRRLIEVEEEEETRTRRVRVRLTVSDSYNAASTDGDEPAACRSPMVAEDVIRRLR